MLKKGFLMAVLNEIRIEGKGQNYENQNIKVQKDHQKCFKASEHRKCLFSSSLLLQSEHRKCLFSSSLLQQSEH